VSVTPSQLPLVPKMKKDLILSLLEEGRRIDGRGPREHRPIEIKVNYVEKANGSALVKLGDTIVLSGVKIELGIPFPDAPSEGVLMVNAEFVPIASPFFEPGPPDENAAELARVIDRSLRETRALDLESLVVIPGQKVLIVWNDIYIISHAGNLIDAASIATMAALSTTKLPKVEVTDDRVELIRDELVKPLEIKKKVVTATVAKIGDYYVVDPNDEEELVADARLAVSFESGGVIAGIQKIGAGALSPEDVNAMINLAWSAAQSYLKKLEEFLKEGA